MKMLLAIFATVFAFSAAAQDMDTKPETTDAKKPSKEAKCPTGYFTLSSGYNNNTAIMGFNFEFPVTKNIGVDAGAGTGQWNNVGYVGAKYYLQPCHRGFAFGTGVTYSHGTRGHVYRWQTINGFEEDNYFNKEPLVNVMAAAYRYWSIGRRDRSRLYAQAGWTVALKSGNKFTQLSGAPITSAAAKEFNAIAPGGPVFAMGISFGLR